MEKVIIENMTIKYNYEDEEEEIEENKVAEVEEKEETTFQDYLYDCDAETQIKFSYIDELLCETDDKIVEIFEEIQKAQIDEDIAEKMGQDQIQIDENKRRYVLQQKLKIWEERYEVLEDMYEDMIYQILM